MQLRQCDRAEKLQDPREEIKLQDRGVALLFGEGVARGDGEGEYEGGG